MPADILVDLFQSTKIELGISISAGIGDLPYSEKVFPCFPAFFVL